jgi:hypothetical protein
MTVAEGLRRGEARLRAIGRSRLGLPLALVLILLPYVWVSLQPFNWTPPREVDNGATWSPAGTLVFEQPGLAVTPAPPPWLGWVKRTNLLQIDLRVRAFGDDAGTILTVSEAILARNIVVEQRGSAVIVRLLTACPGAPAFDWTCDVAIYQPDVLLPGVWADLAIQIVPGRLRLLVDERRWDERDLPPVPLRVWDEGYRLALGSETGGSRSWLGEIARVQVRTPGFVGDYVDPAKLDLPPRFRLYGREPKLVPFEAIGFKDVARNTIMYVPMGIALALLGLWPGRLGVLRAILFIGLVSLSLETAQLFVSIRNPSVTDLILNVVGGASGFLALRWCLKAWGHAPKVSKCSNQSILGS